jgi:chain length determinant protein (polysaccharide antigen chain regulator)
MTNINENYIQPDRTDDDEISLIELWQTLVRRKTVIFVTLIAAILLAIIYLLVTPPTFESKVKLLLPKPNSVSLSRPAHPFAQLDPKTVFTGFEAQLKSTNQWRMFIEANSGLFPSMSATARVSVINKHPLSFSKDKDYPAEHIELSYQDQDAGLTAEILRSYVMFTREQYVADLVKQVKDQIERQKENITADITMLKQNAKLKHADDIEHLRAELSLAKSLGITDNQLLRSGDALHGSSSIITTSETVRSYMRGTRVLTAELEALLKRGTDDAYADGLRGKQIELERLANLRISPDGFTSYTQDGEIQIPKYRLKPSKRTTITLAIILGLMLGVFGAFITEFISNAKQRTQ